MQDKEKIALIICIPQFIRELIPGGDGLAPPILRSLYEFFRVNSGIGHRVTKLAMAIYFLIILGIFAYSTVKIKGAKGIITASVAGLIVSVFDFFVIKGYFLDFFSYGCAYGFCRLQNIAWGVLLTAILIPSGLIVAKRRFINK